MQSPNEFFSQHVEFVSLHEIQFEAFDDGNRFENWRYLQFPNDFLRQHVDFVHFHKMEFVGFVEIIKFEN